ncbi:hypothetical protein LTR36_009197 [Oleoguttula mirabilis]|uniref:PPM-type phosphatase domain-containing protein n=1 Tax=Oleoguttula mirabilis TaxID=1507867 RepID=A0AAV9J6V7_9PEZI|nr:hypothetical protein LTR36_009197 [Oleoguttula mirabilis]
MWSRRLQRCRVPVHRTVRFTRKYNDQAIGPHTTYFQPPPSQQKPPRRIFRSILLATSCLAAGAYAHAWIYNLPFMGFGLEIEDEDGLPTSVETEALEDAMGTAVQAAAATQVPPMDLMRAQEMLESRAGYSVTPKAVSHTCQHPSNLPCEDTWSSGAFNFFNDQTKDWCEWAIFDGHAGPRTAELLKQVLPSAVGQAMWEAKCFERSYTPNDGEIIATIKKAFVSLDNHVINQSRELIESGKLDKANIIAAASAVHSGSCALLALYDPKKHILRVANTGDSRAVLGRWDKEGGKYAAQLLSHDQTGFNPEEVARLKRDHPDEDVVDPKSGRVHGIAVSRAFGDARWKWPQEVTRRAHDLFWGPSPRPDRMIKTPPYLTAEPEVIETRLQTGAHPDFLIMASDGLWDNMSSRDAVACVELWLEKNKPTNFLEKAKEEGVLASLGFGGRGRMALNSGTKEPSAPTYSSMADLNGEDDTYFDKDGSLMWRVSPKHFVNEDQNCGIHLVKNALGGKRRDLFCGVMSVQPPLSRAVRDDITVHVVFFGVDTQDLINN